MKQIALATHYPATLLQIAPDESHLAAIRDEKLQIWRLHPPHLVREFKSDEVANFAWTPNGRNLVVIYQPGASKAGEIWDLNGKTRALEVKNSISHTETILKFSPNGQNVRLISPVSEREWDLKSGKLLWQRRWKPATARDGPRVAFTPDWPNFISPSGESVVIDETTRIVVVNARSGKMRWSQNFSARPLSLNFAFSGDERELIATEGEKFYVYNAQNGVLKRTLSGPPHQLFEMCAAPQNDAVYFLDLAGNVFRQRTR